MNAWIEGAREGGKEEGKEGGGMYLSLCDLVLVMRELQIHATRVNIHFVTQHITRHSTALNVPSWSTLLHPIHHIS